MPSNAIRDSIYKLLISNDLYDTNTLAPSIPIQCKPPNLWGVLWGVFYGIANSQRTWGADI